MDADTAIVITGGDPAATAPSPTPAFVIAADSGLEHAAGLGLTVDLVVGDMDSVDPEALAAAVAAGAEVEPHSPDKDATDFQLALDAAVARGARRVIVAGGTGGRLDHLLGNALLIASPRYSGVEIEWLAGPHRVVAVHGRADLAGRPGDLVTLLPVGGPARGVHTSGLRWKLDGEDLPPGTTRGVSNVMTASTATVEVGDGALLAIHTAQDHPPKAQA